MKVNQLKLGSILSYLQMALNAVVGLLYTPLMIRMLGPSEYGLYSTASSTIAMLSVLSLGLNSGYVRYFARYKKSGDEEAIRKLNGLFLQILSIIGLVALGSGMALCNNLELIFDTGLTVAEYRIARTLTVLLTVNLALSFPMSVFTSIISANERFVFLKLVGMIKTLGGPLATLPLLMMGYRSVAMVGVTVGISLVSDVLYIGYTFGPLRNKFSFGGYEKGIVRGLFGYTVFIALNMVVDKVNWNVGKVFLGRFCGTEQVAVFSVGVSLYNYYHLFSTSISNVFTPRIHRIVSNYEQNVAKLGEELTALFIRVGRIQYLVLGLIASGIVLFGRPFIVNIWAGAGYENSYVVAVMLVLCSIIDLVQNIGIEIQQALNRHRFRSYAYCAMMLINIVITLVLCRRYGAIGCAVGTSTSLVVANGLVMNTYYHKRCHLDIIAFWKNIGRITLGMLPAIALGVLLIRTVDLNRTIVLVGSILVYSVVYCASVWFLSMDESEKALFGRAAGRIFGKLTRRQGI